LARALNGPFQSSAFPVKLTGLFAVDAIKQPFLHCLLHVGIESLSFAKGDDGKLHADLELLIAGFDSNGASPHNSYKPVSIAIDPAKQKEAFQKGIFVIVAYPLKKPGPYQLRAAIRERASGATGTASQFVMAPDLSKGKPGAFKPGPSLRHHRDRSDAPGHPRLPTGGGGGLLAADSQCRTRRQALRLAPPF
jgi:hypothetical protein